jgi:DNA helicase-2/ATP-dependent DNA helicase PcrA
MSKAQDDMEYDDEAEKLINDFLSTFANISSDKTPVFDDFEDDEPAGLFGVKMSYYNKPNRPDDWQDKVERFKTIIKSLELKQTQKTEQPLSGKTNFLVDYKNELNASQLEAVTSGNGPVLVVAGAGSGKTRTIIYRVSYLLESGIEPERILLLTFTRKAANEMVDRANKLLNNKEAGRVFAGTFHAFSNFILRRYSAMIDIPSNFTIVDTPDSEDIIDLIRQELKYQKTRKAFPKKGRLQEVISRSRNLNQSIAQVLEEQFPNQIQFADDINVIAGVYSKYKAANSIFDYDDLMEIFRNKLLEIPQFKKSVSALFDFILVDEFQDTNYVQKQILDAIVNKEQNIMVVGDDAQGIYAFRGANFENILRFPETYPNCKLVKLEENYRSTTPILEFTNAILVNNELSYPKKLFSKQKGTIKPKLQRFYDVESEAEFIAQKILEYRENNTPLEEIAVLYRAGFHGNLIQTELLKRGIPYMVYGGIKFTEKRHIKDIISFLKIILNPIDSVAWNRILKLIPGIGQTFATKILRTIREKGTPAGEEFSTKLFFENLVALEELTSTCSSESLPLHEKVKLIIDFYAPFLKNLESDYELRVEEARLLEKLSENYDSLEKFLTDFALDPPSNKFQDGTVPVTEKLEDKPMIMSTVHSSKGLEWSVVFIPHLMDGLFPGSKSVGSIKDLEEERRLFYVACTRAKKHLYLTLPTYYSTFDGYLSYPSRFLAEMPENLFETKMEKL